jgi:pyridoxamine 5'-phosphate oxidase-like protein
VNWSDLESQAPEIARLGAERLNEAGVALLGTLRADGSPRISPVEPYFAEGELVFGSMAWSAKTRDLGRDPRCVLHSAVAGPDTGVGELKLYGRALEASARLRAACSEGWWHARPSAAAVFALAVERAVFVSWDLEHGRLTVHRWSPGPGAVETTRPYP